MDILIKEQARCIAHEIRNHLSICELYTQVIRKNIEKEDIQNSSIDNALTCITKSLKIMANSLLDLKSLDNFEPKVCNIKTLLQEAINLSNIYIQDKNIKITSDISNNSSVLVDENKFLACIVNIIKNAIEAIESNGEIKVSNNISDDIVIIRISNNGSPIPLQKQREIFNEGFTTKATGSGLGLFICKNNLKVQKANLRLVKSTPKITEFEITLPIYKN